MLKVSLLFSCVLLFVSNVAADNLLAISLECDGWLCETEHIALIQVNTENPVPVYLAVLMGKTWFG